MNRLTFTIGDVVSSNPCLDGLDRMTRGLSVFTGTTELSLLTATANNAGDLLWGLQLTQLSELEQKIIAVKVAIFAARKVLHLFKAENPGDLRPRQAIEAAEACVIAEFSSESMDAAAGAAERAAVGAAYAAANAAYAERAAYAAARAAARTAADAADAAIAAHAADAADAAIAADTALEKEVKIYMIELLMAYV